MKHDTNINLSTEYAILVIVVVEFHRSSRDSRNDRSDYDSQGHQPGCQVLWVQTHLT